MGQGGLSRCRRRPTVPMGLDLRVKGKGLSVSIGCLDENGLEPRAFQACLEELQSKGNEARGALDSVHMTKNGDPRLRAQETERGTHG